MKVLRFFAIDSYSLPFMIITQKLTNLKQKQGLSPGLYDIGQ